MRSLMKNWRPHRVRHKHSFDTANKNKHIANSVPVPIPAPYPVPPAVTATPYRLWPECRVDYTITPRFIVVINTFSHLSFTKSTPLFISGGARWHLRQDSALEQRSYKITYIIIVSTSQADIDYLPQSRASDPRPPPRAPIRRIVLGCNWNFYPKAITNSAFSRRNSPWRNPFSRGVRYSIFDLCLTDWAAGDCSSPVLFGHIP